MYKIKKDGWGYKILRLTDNFLIPINLGNTDYQAYLQWLAEGNEPLPADEPEQSEEPNA